MANKKNIYDYLIFFLITSLIFGNLGGALMVVRVLGVIFFFPIIQHLYSCQKLTKGFIAAFTLFMIYAILSLAWSSDRSEGVVELLYYFTHIAIFLEILVFSFLAKNPVRTIATGWIVVVFISLIFAIWEITTSNHLTLSSFEAEDVSLNTNGISFNRPFASVTFGNFNGYVTFLCFSFPFLLYAALASYGNLKRLFIPLLCIFVTVFVILVEGSRGGLLSISLMLLVVFLMSKTSTIKKLIILFIAIGLGSYFLSFDPDLFMAIMVKSEGGNLYTDDSRMAIWGKAISVGLDYVGFGCGIGGLGIEMQKGFNGPPIPHNMFLELFAEFGFIFLIVFIAYIVKLLLKAIKSNIRSIKVSFIAAILALPFYSIIDSGYLLNPITYVCISCMTVVLNIKQYNFMEYTLLLEEKMLRGKK